MKRREKQTVLLTDTMLAMLFDYRQQGNNHHKTQDEDTYVLQVY